MSSLKKEFTAERPYPFLELLLILWPGGWKKQLNQLNAPIMREYRSKVKHKPSVYQVKELLLVFFIFLGIITLLVTIDKWVNYYLKRRAVH